MHMKSLIGFLFLSVSLLFTSLSAQTYFTAVGVRVGNSVGISAAQRILPQVTAEAILQNDLNNTTYLHLIGRYHKPVLRKNLNAYFGGGLHFGTQNEVGGVAGVDGVMGLELNLNHFSISADLKPQWTSGPNNGLILNSGVTVRYILLKDNVFTPQGRESRYKKRNKSQMKKNRQKDRQAKKKLRKGLFG